MLNRLQRLIKLLQWKAIHRGPRRDVTLQTWNGVLTCDSTDWLIGKYLFVNRSYERDNILNTFGFLKSEGLLRGRPEDLVLDVGANIGMIAIALVKHGFFQRAAAFEPDPNNYRLLRKNVEQNDLDRRVVTFPLGLSSSAVITDGNAILEHSPDNFGDHRIRYSSEPGFFHEENRSTVSVNLKTMDQVIEDSPELRAEDIGVIWVDIQGHEGHFFDGARKLLQRRIPIVSEFWPYAILRSGMSRNEYLEIVRSLFTHVYVPEGDRFRQQPIGQLGELFDQLESPRSGTQIIFL